MRGTQPRERRTTSDWVCWPEPNSACRTCQSTSPTHKHTHTRTQAASSLRPTNRRFFIVLRLKENFPSSEQSIPILIPFDWLRSACDLRESEMREENRARNGLTESNRSFSSKPYECGSRSGRVLVVCLCWLWWCSVDTEHRHIKLNTCHLYAFPLDPDDIFFRFERSNESFGLKWICGTSGGWTDG